ncbi:ADP-glyceromanno-heptose 6-epimerase [Pelagibius litoralis]|uniref:ADP-L-glycero-D-manno-heptose-6-epimerase n=1 Tax=Pelagibius litoralis TaxID=374515 RepID=A0A967KG94_9PROT|nr:ADP-glyceromanno-heptose 6-epimerase [Pelagibius litoralis]NIA71940.1 ADP-glyceromanno-heptose 6-epimerase [Pelagibius litoralis]
MLLVTGGAGFIGSNLVAALAERGEAVVVCDRLGQGDKWRNLAHHEIEDVIPPEELPEFLRWAEGRLKGVFHMGAISATTENDGDALMANNFRLSKVFWDHCTREEIPFIYASSAATYGDGALGFDDDSARGYLAGLRPLNGYGWSKHLFDRWVMRRLAAEAPAPKQWAGLKFFNVYGPNEYHKGGQASVAFHLFGQLSRGEGAKLFQSHHPDYADGGQLRDFIWVDDCVAVMLWLYDNPAVSGLFNVGTGKARSFADLARAVFAAMEQPENISYVPTPEAIRDKYQYFTEATMARLRAAGYEKPFTELEEGVARYVKDFLVKPDPYR